MSTKLREHLEGILNKFNSLNASMADASGKEIVELSKEASKISDIAQVALDIKEIDASIADNNLMIEDEDCEAMLKELAEEENAINVDKISQLELRAKSLMIPKDEDDDNGVMLEIRAGTGGDEAALFASDLMRMYIKYAESRRWASKIVRINEIGVGGVREAIISIDGKGVFGRLKFESGVHRVQRVPTTETSGRLHTSAATVAVLPEVNDISVVIADKDIRIDTYRSSGAGGQHVNTTDSAVRITHIPTNIVVTQQDEKSQHKNKAKALKILASRVYDHQKQEQDKERTSERRSQIGTGDRSERIRTYNFPQSRMTDHRINFTTHNLDGVLAGDLDDLINELAKDLNSKLLETLEV